MTFTDALSAVFNDGDLITREVWNQRADIGLDDGKLSINGYLDDRGQWVGDGQKCWMSQLKGRVCLVEASLNSQRLVKRAPEFNHSLGMW